MTYDENFTITVNDVDEFNTSAVSDSDAASNSVAENAANGTVVGITAFASDADATNHAITYSLDDDAQGRFTIDANTGVVTVLDGSKLDYENASQHTIVVRATSQDSSSSTKSFNILLTDQNEGGVTQVVDSNASSNAVDENATVGTVVGITGFATDPDGTDVVTYSLDNNDGGRFAIDAVTGWSRSMEPSIEKPMVSSRSITVRATSTDGSFTTAILSIAINDLDEFNVGSVTDSDGTANSVAENASIGTVVGITG